MALLYPQARCKKVTGLRPYLAFVPRNKAHERLTLGQGGYFWRALDSINVCGLSIGNGKCFFLDYCEDSVAKCVCVCASVQVLFLVLHP